MKIKIANMHILNVLILRDKIRHDHDDTYHGINELDGLTVTMKGNGTITWVTYEGTEAVLAELGDYIESILELINSRIITATELGIRRDVLRRDVTRFPCK